MTQSLERHLHTIAAGWLAALGTNLRAEPMKQWIIDPEVLAYLVTDLKDPVLTQELGTWQAANEMVFSAKRLKGVASQAPCVPDWPAIQTELHSARRETDLRTINIEHRAFIRLRFRALMGAGAGVEVLLALATYGSSSTHDLAQLIGFSQQTVINEVNRFKQYGWVRRGETSSSHYQLTESALELTGKIPKKSYRNWIAVLALTQHITSCETAPGSSGASLDKLAALQRFLDTATRFPVSEKLAEPDNPLSVERYLDSLKQQLIAYLTPN